MATGKIYVWDPIVRISHWALVMLFILAYLTGDEKGPLHRNIGYVIVLLTLSRVLWGFIGSRYALFSDFVCPPRMALGYLKDLAAGKAQYHIGHNPAAAWMILFLLTTSLIVCTSGLMACNGRRNTSSDTGVSMNLVSIAYADDREHKGKHHRRWRDEAASADNSQKFWGEFHEVSAEFFLFLIGLHVAGVLVSSRAHKENLIQSMISGRKMQNRALTPLEVKNSKTGQ